MRTSTRLYEQFSRHVLFGSSYCLTTNTRRNIDALIWSAFPRANATTVENEKRKYVSKHVHELFQSNYDLLMTIDAETVANLVRCTEAILCRMHPRRMDLPGIQDPMEIRR